jgi:hypothetical protein
MIAYHAQAEIVDAAIARFPETFGLRAYPGEQFRISRASSYVNDSDVLQLYTERLCEDGKWHSFAKGTESELRNEVTK